MNFSRLVAGLLTACFVGGAASAATVKVTFEGTVDYLHGFDSTPIKVGQRVSATQIIDTDASHLATGGGATVFPFLGGVVNNHTLGQSTVFDAALTASPFLNSIQVHHSASFGYHYQFRSSNNLGASAGAFVNFPVGQVINHSSLNPFISLLRSNGVAGLSQTNASLIITSFTGSGWWGDCPPSQVVCDVVSRIRLVTVSDVQAVPIPAALPLMVLGLAGLGIAGRRRKV